MKKLFLYYSLTSNGETLVPYFAEKGYEIRQIEMKKKLPKRFFFRVLTGGFLAMLNKKPELLNYEPNVSMFDEIVIGSPIWNGRFAIPLNTVLEQTDFSNKKLTFVLYAGSGIGPKAEKKIKKIYPDAKIIFLKQPKKYPQELKKISSL